MLNASPVSFYSLLLLSIPLFGSGCELDDFLNEFDDVPSCSSGAGNFQAGGTWRLSGAGSRTGCEDDRFNGDFSIPEVELDVRQVTDPQNPNLDRLELAVVPTVPNGTFTFEGTVTGSCVDFTTREDSSAGFFLFRFDGNQDGQDIGGDFSAEGPPGCTSTGDFRVVLE